MWTNAFCGHPAPGEETADAVLRRATFELGIAPADLSTPQLILPDFSYRAVDSSGTVENEICPVYTVELSTDAAWEPNPDEVDSYQWVEPAQLFAAADAMPGVFSPWMIDELADDKLRAAL